jgi:RNA polymerase sigma-70 factor (ECF subfamily)
LLGEDPVKFSDQALVEEIRAGSSVAFERLMVRYRRLVFRIAFGFTRSEETAMDLTQETFLRVHARLGEWRGDGEIKYWISRIASNLAMNQARGERRHPLQPLDDEPAETGGAPQEAALHRQETRHALHRSLSTLHPRQRQAVVLRYFESMSVPEIAAALDCSEGTARNTLFRGLKRLRTVLTRTAERLP